LRAEMKLWNNNSKKKREFSTWIRYKTVSLRIILGNLVEHIGQLLVRLQYIAKQTGQTNAISLCCWWQKHVAFRSTVRFSILGICFRRMALGRNWVMSCMIIPSLCAPWEGRKSIPFVQYVACCKNIEFCIDSNVIPSITTLCFPAENTQFINLTFSYA